MVRFSRFLSMMIVALSVACNNVNTEKTNERHQPVDTDTTKPTTVQSPSSAPSQAYHNERFKDVTIQRLGDTTFQVTGKAQVFEASFSWIIEDGHNELKQGHQMTDAGAPEWGKFDFTVTAKNQRENSTLHLVLFEASAMDGSRQHELAVPLP